MGKDIITFLSIIVCRFYGSNSLIILSLLFFLNLRIGFIVALNILVIPLFIVTIFIIINILYEKNKAYKLD